MSEAQVRVGVQVIVQNAVGEVLMARRARGFGRGTWGIPGGHLEPDETIIECALRELLEETGTRGRDARVFCVSDPDSAAHHHMQVGVSVGGLDGEPRIVDPGEVAEVRFFAWDDLPADIFPPALPVLRAWRTGAIHQPAASVILADAAAVSGAVLGDQSAGSSW